MNFEIEFLKKIEIFSCLNDQQLESIVPSCNFRSYEKGKDIVLVDDESKDVYGVCSGIVRVSNFTLSGREIIYDNIQEGGIFGEMAALDSLRRSASVYALSDIRVVKIDHNSFNQIMLKYPCVAIAVAKHLVAVIRLSSKRIVDTSSRSTAMRLLLLISEMAETGKTSPNCAEIKSMPTHRLLSGQLGCTRETVTRLLQSFEDEGLIKRQRHYVTIPNLSSIMARINSEADL